MSEKRGSFSGKLGFIMAAAGSAVGLGNIWRFPYLAAKYGGGVFLLIYLILTLTFGYVLMKTEIALGRKTGFSAIGAFKALNKKWSFLGVLGALIPIIILPYYSVIGGWVSKYLFAFATGEMSSIATDSSAYFGAFITDPTQAIGWFLLFIGVTSVVVMFGVEKGIEKVSKVMMPVLVVLAAAIAGYSLFIPGALEGVKYYIIPDFSRIADPSALVNTILAAMGQLFYSMSLAMGIMITYGSYMKKDVNLESSVKSIELFDTGIAFMAGMMIIPGVFAFSGGDPEKLNKGAGLMFETLPNVFNSMGDFGNVVGALFFLLVLVAALTSSISLMETVVSIFMDKFGWKRRLTCVVVLAVCLMLGVPSALGYGVWSGFAPLGLSILDFCDFVSNSVMMPIVAFLTCIFVGYVIKPDAIIEEARVGISGKPVGALGRFRRETMYKAMVRYIAPLFIVAILVFSSLESLGFIKI